MLCHQTPARRSRSIHQTLGSSRKQMSGITIRHELWPWLDDFIRSLTEGLKPFCLQGCRNSSDFQQAVGDIPQIFLPTCCPLLLSLCDLKPHTSHSCCNSVSCTSLMGISHPTTSQRWFNGFRSCVCGGHWSKVNSSCSGNQFEMMWALWSSQHKTNSFRTAGLAPTTSHSSPLWCSV